MKYLDTILNNITTYRLVLYCLFFLLGLSIILSFAGILPYNGFSILFSALFLLLICKVTNYTFSLVFKAPINVESYAITALILALLIAPIESLENLPFLFWAGVLSQATKYILAFNRKHIFNPVAIALVLAAFGLNQSASWWVGNPILAPFVAVTGLIILRKARRWDVIFTFFITAFIHILFLGWINGTNSFTSIAKHFAYTPLLLFFASFMLTEPLSMPPTKKLRILYGVIVGFLIPPQFNIFSLYLLPELALVIGNVFSYIVSPKKRIAMKLEKKLYIAKDNYEFIFRPEQKLNFQSGQYLEWTLAHKNPDSRGNRRYFTISSSPTQHEVSIGIKIAENASSFKKGILKLEKGEEIIAAQLSGDFVLPTIKNQKVVFIAGGIGITPFRSMVQFLLTKKESRSIVLFYIVKSVEDIAYKALFDDAEREIGMKTIYVISDKSTLPHQWSGEVGRLNEKIIMDNVMDYKERKFFLSGPNAMVNAYKTLIKGMGIKNKNIVTDYFPGF